MPDTPQNPDSSAEKAEADKDVLDLLGGAPSRRQRRKQKAIEEHLPAPPVEPIPSELDEKKKKALDLVEFGDDQPKPKKKKTVLKTGLSPSLASIGAPSLRKPVPVKTVDDPLAAALRAAGLAPKTTAEAPTAKPEKEANVEAKSEQPAAEETAATDAPDEGGDEKPVISLKSPILLKDLAVMLGLRPFMLIKDLMEMEIFANPDYSLEVDVAATLCEKHGFLVERERRKKDGGVKAEDDKPVEPEPPPEPPPEVLDTMQLRAPIITFMGHVDHGKTSLLDSIRKARVAAGEAGGITQHIGAYSVEHNGQPITFLDTPGHAIFTQMRARGASATDIVVLVVAADDGFMPQTDEALSHARAAGVTIMVAINKIDLATANVDRVLTQMQERDLMSEEWGGDTITVRVSAHTGEGLEQLLDMMALQSEVLELKADPKENARGTVIEARMETGRGPVATVIVRTGTIRTGMPFICGPFHGKVKSLLDDLGNKIKEVGPGLPAEIVGFSDLPNVGDEMVEMKSDRDAKRLSTERQEELRTEKLQAPQRARLENLFASMDSGRAKELRIVLKGDVQGSVEAIAGALGDIPSDKVRLNIIHSAAGPISDSDVLLASASDAIVIGFNVKLESNAVKTAKRESVQVKLYSIVYELIDQIREAMSGLLEPETRESQLGHAKVLQVFKIKRGRVGGCMVMEGRILRKGRARVVRDGQVVYDGPIGTLRRYQEDVDEIKAGNECGIRLGDYNEYEVGDIIECYNLEKVQQTL